jgi:hypothetical protein
MIEYVSTEQEIKEVMHKALRMNCGMHPSPVAHFFKDEGEIWISIRRPELYPYDYDWFIWLDKSERAKWGLKIAEIIPL